MIIGSIVRYLNVSDLERSIVFYRERLGFQVKRHENGASAKGGPLRLIQLRERVDQTGLSTVSVWTHDVEATRAELLARGALPSAIETVTQRKTREFEVRDPDGHAVLFWQSYREEPDSTPRS